MLSIFLPGMSPLIRMIRLVLTLTLVASAASATTITFVMTTTASGIFGGTPFNNELLTVTSTADTGQVMAIPSGSNTNYLVFASFSTVNIMGFAPAIFTNPMPWLDPNGSGDIIFGGTSIGNGLLGFTNPDPAVGLTAYNLQSSFGPVFSPFDFEVSVFNNFQNIPTSGGSLTVTTAGNDVFNAALAAPEPVSLVSAGLGMLLMFAIKRRTG